MLTPQWSPELTGLPLRVRRLSSNAAFCLGAPLAVPLLPAWTPRPRMRHQDTQRWESLTLDKYLAKKPRAGTLRYGTLDLCAQGLSCQYMDEENILQGFEVICRPVVCQAGSASCIYSAVQEAVPQLSDENLCELATVCPAVIVEELPDACSANDRKRAKTYDVTADSEVWHVRGSCGSHQLRRIIAARQQTLVGDVHAISVTCSATGTASEMQTALRHWLTQLVVIKGRPCHENLKRNKLIVENTLMRHEQHIDVDRATHGAATSIVDLLEPDHAVSKFLKFWNGNWRLNTPVHWCDGCCRTAQESQAHGA